MAFEIYFKPSGTIGEASTAVYGAKDTSSTVTVDDVTYSGSSEPTVTEFNDSGGGRWLILLDDLVEGDYTVELEDSMSGPPMPPPAPPPQTESFSFSVDGGPFALSITHPANNGSVRCKNVVTWGPSSHSISEATLTINGMASNGTIKRDAGNGKPYVVQFLPALVMQATAATIKIKNSNNDEVTINVTVNP